MSSNVAAHTVLLRPLILGSTSRYRRELLARLHLPFEVEAPHVDETPEAGEQPEALARRLARFFRLGHTPGQVRVTSEPRNPSYPFTLDLRRPAE